MAQTSLPKPSETSGNSSLGGTIIALIVTTLLAAAAGVLYSLQGPKVSSTTSAAPTVGESPKAALTQAVQNKELQDIPAVVTNLVFPTDVWIRLEGSIILDRLPPLESKTLIAEIAQDTLAYVRTLSLPQLQSVAGLQNLREDLDERIVIRSKGRAREFMIRSLVLQ